MPNRNGTGPEGKGPKTGRGLGSCSNGTTRGAGRGAGAGVGRGRGLGRGAGQGLNQNVTNDKGEANQEK